MPRRASTPSLLYSSEAAEALDEEHIRSLGLNGLLELAAYDHRFGRFEDAFFSASASRYSRALQTAEANARLDANIEALLALLSRHFLAHAAHKLLEYLVRRFGAHEHNARALLGCALPHHGTRWFVRVAQLLPRMSKSRKWQRSGVPPTREALVLQCCRDHELLTQVASLAR